MMSRTFCALIAFGVLSLSFGASASAQDAVQWTVEEGGNGHWYQVVHDQGISWTAADSTSDSAGGHLATATSEDENRFLGGIATIDDAGPGWWLGARKIADDEWAWITGEAWDYTSWGQAGAGSGCNQQPDGRDAIDLYCVSDDGTPMWSDDYLDWKFALGYIIEWSADCNGDGIVDYGQMLDGSLLDTNDNHVPDICEYLPEDSNHVLMLGDYESVAVIPHHPSLNPGDELTIEFWAKIESDGRMITKRPGDGGSYTIAAVRNGETCTVIGSIFGACQGVPSPEFGTDWVHLAIVVDGPAGTTSTYVNGGQPTVNQGASCSIAQGDWELRFGNTEGFPTTQFRGRLDNIRIWNEALRAEEIRFWMNNRITPERTSQLPSLAGSWDFENGVADATGVNNGSLIGNATIVFDEGRFSDCNGDGAFDYEQILDGELADCNANTIPDLCELSDIKSARVDRTPESISDFIDFDVTDMSDADGDVALQLTALGDLSGIGEFLWVYLDEQLLELAFVDDGAACEEVSTTLTVLASEWNDAGLDGTRLIRISATNVESDACSGPFVAIDVTVPVPFEDCDGSGTWDACDIASGLVSDLDGNGIPDGCDPDCDGDGEPDGYEISSGQAIDCNGNLVPDSCDIADGGSSNDVDSDGVPDDCQPDCDGDGVPDSWELAEGLAMDCNENAYPDNCDILEGASNDIDSNGVPDECKDDCNGNGIPDYWEIAQGDIADCDGNDIPDPCDIAAGNLPDCDNDLVSDDCAIEDGIVDDCNENGVPDACDLADGLEEDDNANDILDGCELARGDLNLDGCIDGADLAILLGLWGLPNPPIGDLNGDGTVSGSDLAVVLGNWSPCP